MKKIKTAVWVLIIAFVIVLVYQNQAFFLETKQSLNLNLVFAEYKTPELKVIFFCGAFALAGFLFGLYFLAAYGFKTKKKTKALNAQLSEQTEKATSLEDELNTLKGHPAVGAMPDTPPNTDTVVINPAETAQVSENKS